MSYWRKKLQMKKIRCCGKTSKGERCKKEFYPNADGITTCSIHKDQKNATCWYSSEIGLFKDVSIIIGKYIDDPSTFFSFSQVCKSTAKACHELQEEKMTMWKKIIGYNPQREGSTKRYILPNGSIIDENNKFINRFGSVTEKFRSPILKYRNAKPVFINVNFY